MQIKSSLVCPDCGQQTLHDLHYAGPVLHEITCAECGKASYAHHHPVGGYLLEWRGRLLSKPRRMYREVSKNPIILFRLSRRVVSKPTRVTREFFEVLH